MQVGINRIINRINFSAGASAMAEQLYTTEKQPVFEGPYFTQKVAQTEKSKELYRTEIKPVFLEVTSGGIKPLKLTAVSIQNGENIFFGNSDLTLSNFRGELGVNRPLGADAIHTNGGRVGQTLNLIS